MGEDLNCCSRVKEEVNFSHVDVFLLCAASNGALSSQNVAAGHTGFRQHRNPIDEKVRTIDISEAVGIVKSSTEVSPTSVGLDSYS